MSEMNISDILKLAAELGIEFELDSKTPGFFVTDQEGQEKEVSLDKLFGVKKMSCREIDQAISQAISQALSHTRYQPTLKVTIDDKYLKFSMLDGVA